MNDGSIKDILILCTRDLKYQYVNLFVAQTHFSSITTVTSQLVMTNCTQVYSPSQATEGRPHPPGGGGVKKHHHVKYATHMMEITVDDLIVGFSFTINQLSQYEFNLYGIL
jgi:hypothetical protein